MKCRSHSSNPAVSAVYRDRENLWSFPLNKLITGMVGLAPKWVILAPNGTNPGLFQIRFQYTWLIELADGEGESRVVCQICARQRLPVPFKTHLSLRNSRQFYSKDFRTKRNKGKSSQFCCLLLFFYTAQNKYVCTRLFTFFDVLN